MEDMMTHAQYQTRRIQNRHILAQLGVMLWADRGSSTVSLTPKAAPPEAPEALAHQTDPVSVPAVNTRDVKLEPSSKAAKNPRQIIDTLLKATAKTKENLTTDALSADIKAEPIAEQSSAIDSQNTVAAHAIEFHLQAIIYRQWLILVDSDALDTAGRELWMSLNQAIKNQAQRSGAAFYTKTLDYPLFTEDGNTASVSTANTSLKGFIFGCMIMANQLRHMAVLTALPDYLMLDSIHQITLHKRYQINDMLMHADIKKQFWQLIHSPSDA